MCDCDDSQKSSVNNKSKTITRKLINKKNLPKIKNNKLTDIECTLVIIKPDAMEHRNLIEKIINNEGFEICSQKIVQLTPEQAVDFYSNKYSQLNFPDDLMLHITSGPLMALILAKNRAIEDLLRLIGPENVKKIFY